MKKILTTVPFVYFLLPATIFILLILQQCNNGERNAAKEEPLCPQFPIPVPRASAMKIIPKKLLLNPHGITSLDSVVNKISNALEKSGYESSFYCVRDSGIAIVTRIEK